MKSSLRHRITALFLLLAVIPLFISGLFISWRIYKGQLRQTMELQQEVANRAINEILLAMHEHEDKFISLTRLFNLLELEEKQLKTVLSKMRSHKDLLHQDIIDELALFDDRGRMLASASRTGIGPAPDPAAWPDFATLLASATGDKVHYHSVMVDGKTGEPFFFLAVPIQNYETGALTGVLAGRLRLSLVWKGIVKRPVGSQGLLYIADQSGKVVAHENPSIVLRGAACDISGATPILTGLDGEKVIRTTDRIQIGNQIFFVIVDLPFHEAMALAYHTITSIAGFMLFFLLAGIAAGMFAAGRLIRPIASLVQTARSIAAGNLTCQADINRQDEIGQLARAFNSMTTRLIADIRQRQETEAALMHIRSELEATVEERTAELRRANLKLRQEVSDHERTGQALASEKERLAVTLGSIGEGVIAADMQGAVILINNVAEMLTGWSRQEAVGRPLPEIFQLLPGGGAGGQRLSPVADILRTGAIAAAGSQAVLVARNGSIKDIAMSGAPIKDAGRQAIGIVLVFRDITDQKRTEEELLKVRKLESVGILAGGIAHDFNNILAAILGNINLALVYTEAHDKRHALLTNAENASLRARDLTQQLLTFAKGGEPVKKIASIAEVIRESAGFILRGSNIKCRFHLPDDLWPVEMDPGQMSQVIQNLILNACHAMPAGGFIDIYGENLPGRPDAFLPLCQDDCLKIMIQDSGTGIPAKLLDKIFDPYFSTKQQGSGLGLAITHSIIKKHGGHITVASDFGHGAVFTIYLQAFSREKPGMPAGEETAGKEVAGKGRILVMDDEESVRDVAQGMLAYLGYDTVFARDGQEAVELYRSFCDRQEKIEAVIMDLTIPGAMGGKEAVGLIHAIDPAARVIVASGYSNDPVMAHHRDYGFVDRIDKPFQLRDFSRMLHRVFSPGRA
jgi:PAS domain S-box-containing protein